VDTSVWSLALRRDAPPDVPEVMALRDALGGGEIIATTGVILQELLQGVVPERTRKQIAEMFAALEYLSPSREDHVAAAGVRNLLRSAGVQVGTFWRSYRPSGHGRRLYPPHDGPGLPCRIQPPQPSAVARRVASQGPVLREFSWISLVGPHGHIWRPASGGRPALPGR
jgi:predicted nucleic acid-binding protein